MVSDRRSTPRDGRGFRQSIPRIAEKLPTCDFSVFWAKKKASRNSWLREAFYLVDLEGLEPSTSALRTPRSPN